METIQKENSNANLSSAGVKKISKKKGKSSRQMSSPRNKLSNSGMMLSGGKQVIEAKK